MLETRSPDEQRRALEEGRRGKRRNDRKHDDILAAEEGTDEKPFRHTSETRQGGHRYGEGRRFAKAKTRRIADLPGDVGAERHEHAMGEVEDAERAPDKRQAGGHQTVERAQDKAAREHGCDRLENSSDVSLSDIERHDRCVVDAPPRVDFDAAAAVRHHHQPVCQLEQELDVLFDQKQRQA